MYNFHIFQFFELGNMYQLKKCCCCVDLRTGAIVMAILEIIGGLGMFGNPGGWPNYLNAVITIGAGACLLFGAIKCHQTAIPPTINSIKYHQLVYLVLEMVALVLIGVAMFMAIIWATAATVLILTYRI